VLDGQGQVVPIGVVGELYVGGAGLARGYQQQASLTAERFVPDPFSRVGGARLYRTGDLVRWSGAGLLEFVGRVDGQVKVRGYRVEVGEVEAVLTRHPQVAQAVVTPIGTGAEKQLVAYVVASAGAEIVEDELRAQLGEWLRQQLPLYLVPGQLVVLAELPLLPNGKVDRRALPAVDVSRERGAREYEAPRAGAEQELAQLWQTVLGVAQVSRHDDFFALGGHSLLLVQLAARINKALYVEVPLRCLFEAPTLTEMAEAVTQWQVQQQDPTEMAQMLQELKALSADEITAMLGSEDLTELISPAEINYSAEN
jgi:AMP-binding enzyme/Phosphopantetheine attachment site/AMP-binding enzyme C-terminal domain